MEVWIDLKNYEGYYKVSSLGRVKSLDRVVLTVRGERKFFSKILKPRVDSLDKYLRYSLSVKNKTKDISAHRAVALSFIPNPENKPEVNHIDGDTKNNKKDNLEWVTRQENIQHSYDTGIRKPTILTRTQCHLSKLTEEQANTVIEMRKQGVKYKHIAKKFNMSISGLEKIIAKEKEND